MKAISVVLSLLTVLLFGLSPNAPTTSIPDPADLILKNATIYTASEKQTHAEAVAVKGDRIMFVGANAEVKKFESKDTRVVDLHGATVVPGLTDAHHHLSGVGF